jgi:hypothetical protein
MADTAFRPELLVNLTAALGIVAKACGLPPGWVAKPSFRITPQGASLQVVWSATPAARVQCERKEVKKRRSRSSRQRSADRAAAHKARSKPQMSTSHQQALNPASKSFTPNPAPPPPNSVPAVESEREVGAEESNRNGLVVVVASDPPVPPLLPEPGPQLEVCDMGVDSRGKRGREGATSDTTADVVLSREAVEPLMGTLLAEYERGRGRGPYSERLMGAMSALDSLVGRGQAQAAISNYEYRIRPGLIARGS